MASGSSDQTADTGFNLKKKKQWWHNFTPLQTFFSSRYNNILATNCHFKHFSSGFSIKANNSENNPFSNIIPSVYISAKDKPISIYFNIYDFYLSKFTEEISSTIPKDFVYTCFIKVRYDEDKFFMAGYQFGFDFSSNYEIEKLLEVVKSRLHEYFIAYNLTEDAIVYVQISFRQKSKKLLSEFLLEKPSHTTTHENLQLGEKLNIPISTNENSLGKPLSTNISNGVLSEISLTLDGKLVNFLDIIRDKAKLLSKDHINNITVFDKTFKFYLLRDKYDYVLAVKQLENNFVEKIRYTLHGVVLNRVTDNVVDNVIYRNIGDKQIVIENNKIISTRQNIKLKALEKPNIKPLFVENNNIGVIDIEVYKIFDDIQKYKVYALGFKTNLDDKPIIYYLDKNDLDSNKIIFSLIDELLRTKYSNVTFYCHNLGGFDIVYILNALYTYNDNNPDDNYKISCILRDDKIIKVKISKGKNSLTILDSYSMLPSSLAKLGVDFYVATIKSKFPYRFSTQDHLFYEGSMPSIEHYDEITQEQYEDLSAPYWSFYDETIKYLNNDLYSLHQVLTKANKQIFLDYNINMSESLTISGLAVKIYLKDFYNSNIPNINKASLYKDIKQAYYGGITEVYKPHGHNLYYYDVNSLYPSVALQDMPGLICSKLVFYVNNQEIDNLFGFFYCSIETPLDGYLGLFPIRDIGLTFPLGKWEGWYFSEELKFAKQFGYKIKVLKGYNFNKESNVFTDYINKVYSIKSDPVNPSQKAMAKSLLNNLLGRFGINMDKPVTEILSQKAFSSKMLMYRITSYKELSDDRVMVTYIPKLDHELITSHGLDFLKVVRKHKDNEVQAINITSVVISAAVTAYARIHITKLKLDILRKGGKIYYSDTDSIITDIKLSDDLVSANKLGLLKLEHTLDEAIFISNKIYWMRDEKGKSMVKAKGINSSSLCYTDFIDLLNNKNIDTAVKTQSKIYWDLGYVSIENKNQIKINSNSYTKRDKIFDCNNKWVDTKPIFVNKIDKDLVLYQPKNLVLFKDKNKNKYQRIKFIIINKPDSLE